MTQHAAHVIGWSLSLPEIMDAEIAEAPKVEQNV